MTLNAGQCDKTRSVHAKAILGPELNTRLKDTKILLVGAGGIGCELLKNVVLTGFGNITLLDLDTIDLSNLNRQFLFRKKDIKHSKAMVAARTAHAFNPSVKITPIHENIKDTRFDVAWFRGFDIVLNALDNLDARRHVNRMCLAANVPLVESGTAGYLGQVQPIVKDRTECFDCLPKPVPKSYPVCTIRSTPSQPIHCIVWAKSYLFPQLFGDDEEGEDELDAAEKAGENAREISALRKEAEAFRVVRKALRTAAAPRDGAIVTSVTGHQSNPARLTFDKVFNADICNLLSMEDMWKSKDRVPPVPLDFDKIGDGTFSLPNAHSSTSIVSNGKTNGSVSVNGAGSKVAPPSQQGLKDQKKLSLQECLVLFVSSTHRLSARLQSGETSMAFDKDDDDALDFVTAASNLRSYAYRIEGKSRWEIKEMAGNIIPAIATTNAIIAGVIVLQALQLLKKSYNGLRNVHLQRKAEVPLNACTLGLPSNECSVCRDTYVDLQCDTERTTLTQAIEELLGTGVGSGNGTGPRDVSVYEDKRLLADPDFDDNMDRSLASMGVTHGKFLSIVDEEGELGTISVAIGRLPPNYPIEDQPFLLPGTLPVPPKRVRPPAPPPPATPPRKRPLDTGDGDMPPKKRPKSNGAPNANFTSPSKKRRLEEDGLLIIEDTAEDIDAETIDEGGPQLITIDD